MGLLGLSEELQQNGLNRRILRYGDKMPHREDRIIKERVLLARTVKLIVAQTKS